METITQISLWIIVFLLFTMVISLCIFYTKKLVENRWEEKLNKKKDIVSASTEQRQKIKADILSDLEKKLEAL